MPRPDALIIRRAARVLEDARAHPSASRPLRPLFWAAQRGLRLAGRLLCAEGVMDKSTEEVEAARAPFRPHRTMLTF